MSGHCDDGHCMTCADEGLVMRVLRAPADGVALCAGDDGRELEVVTELVGEPVPGERLLVHAGVALTLLAAEDAR